MCWFDLHRVVLYSSIMLIRIQFCSFFVLLERELWNDIGPYNSNNLHTPKFNLWSLNLVTFTNNMFSKITSFNPKIQHWRLYAFGDDPHPTKNTSCLVLLINQDNKHQALKEMHNLVVGIALITSSTTLHVIKKGDMYLHKGSYKLGDVASWET